MRSPRFYIAMPLAVGETIALPADRAHYAMRVLRLRNHDSVTLFNGEGGEFTGSIGFSKKETLVHITDYHNRSAELTPAATLIQALPSGDKMEWIVEKTTELGIQQIIPVFSNRSVIRLDPERLEKKRQQWTKIAQSACEQCGRNTIPLIEKAMSFAEALERYQPENASLWCTDPQAPTAWQTQLPVKSDRISFAVGPEGGWTPEELKIAQQKGAQLIGLGSRVLRTETASLLLLSGLQAFRA